MTPRPLWRWWLYCTALSLWFRWRWQWALRLQGWCVLRRWVAVDDEDPILADERGAPF